LRFRLLVIKVLQKVPIRTLIDIKPGLKTLQLEEVHRENVFAPIVYPSDSRQLLEVVGDR
jgi:hypothetical protein